MIEKFQRIEAEYNVEDIEYKGEKIWAYLRVNYYWATIQEKTQEYQNKNKKPLYKKIINIIKQSFHGFKNWFGRYEYLFFSAEGQKVNLEENLYFDRNFEYISNFLGNQKCLYIDIPVDIERPMNKTTNYNVVSNTWIGLIAKIVNIFSFNNRTIKISQLDEINKKEKLNVNYEKIIKIFNINVNIIKLLLKIYKPKAIFINCYYGQQALIKAANELNIRTVEIQHGSIGSNHFAYNPRKCVDKSFFPDILLTYGDYDKQKISENKFNPFINIESVGNYYLEKLKETSLVDKLVDITAKYNHTVSVSTQFTVEKKLAEFIKTLAEKYPEVGFIFSLRHFEKSYYQQFNLPSNVHLFKCEYSCYDILKVCKTHLTVYSTCGVEALFFNKKVISVDIEGLSNSFMAEYKDNNIHIIDNIKDFERIIKLKYLEKENLYCKLNYEDNIKKFLNQFIMKGIND